MFSHSIFWGRGKVEPNVDSSNMATWFMLVNTLHHTWTPPLPSPPPHSIIFSSVFSWVIVLHRRSALLRVCAGLCGVPAPVRSRWSTYSTTFEMTEVASSRPEMTGEENMLGFVHFPTNVPEWLQRYEPWTTSIIRPVLYILIKLK